MKTPIVCPRCPHDALGNGRWLTDGKCHGCGYTNDAEVIAKLIGSFPATFGLRAWTGTFRIGAQASYVNDSGVPMLYIQKLVDGAWLDFSKGDEQELRREMVVGLQPVVKPKGKGLYSATPEEREALRAGILKAVTSAYEAYEQAARYAKTAGKPGNEPNITLGYLYGWFDENTSWPGDIDCKPPRVRRLLVRSAAEQLRGQGKLTSSIGRSAAGREARCYEPVSTPNHEEK